MSKDEATRQIENMETQLRRLEVAVACHDSEERREEMHNQLMHQVYQFMYRFRPQWKEAD